MDLFNTQHSYGILSKLFHWVMAVLIVGLLICGWVFDFVDPQVRYGVMLPIHKSLGILVFLLALARLYLRLIQEKPDLSHVSYLHQKAGFMMIVSLYCMMFFMPLTGYLMSSFGGYPVSFFGASLPNFIAKNKDLSHLAATFHDIGQKVMVILLIFHLAAALYHHFILKNNLLTRLWFKKN